MARLAGWGDCPGDSDCDGTPDGQDGCPNDADKIQEGICGCGSPDIDTDQDQVLDCNDQCPQDPDKIEPENCGCGIPETLTCNQIPQQPVPSLPEDSASDIELTPDLHTQAFSDPDIQDSHAGSHWQISTAENFSVLICDHQSQTDLTAFVPPEPLQEDTIYYWRVRFYDNNGGASPWSETWPRRYSE